MNTHTKNRRLYPHLSDPDYLHLSTLRESVRPIAAECRGSVIDYGCGNKPYKDLFTNASQYIGADFGLNGTDLPLGIDGKLPCIDQSYDTVVSFQVLEHIPSPNLFLMECFRVLRPGGTLILTTHGIWPYHPGPQNDDFTRWTSSGLYRIVAENGFHNISIVGACSGFLCLIQQLMVINDPARAKSRLITRLVLKTIYLIINIICVIALKIMPKLIQNGDIIPICYILVAKK